MLNVNYGKNKKLMEACKPLEEYSWLVETIRNFQKAWKSLEEAVDAAINEMPEDFFIKKFLLLNKAEVKGMFLTEYDQEKVLEQERRDSIRLGFNKGVNKTNERFVKNMLQKNYPLSAIEEISQLSENVIRKIAHKLGVTIA